MSEKKLIAGVTKKGAINITNQFVICLIFFLIYLFICSISCKKKRSVVVVNYPSIVHLINRTHENRM